MNPPVPALDGAHFRSALGAFATGVTIVTTRNAQGRDVGLTANSFNSVSLDPPMVLWSLSKNAASLPAFVGNEHFAVHVLAADQQPLSDRFARRGADKFAGLPVTRGAGGVPLLDGCSARFQCRTAFRHEGGDHVIFVGEVLAFDHFDRPPLVFHGGSYAEVLPQQGPGAVAPPPPPGAGAEAAAEVESSFRKDYLGYLLGLASMQLHRAVRARCVQLGLSDEEYYILSVLMARPDSTRAEVRRLLAVSGEGLHDSVVDGLVQRGLVMAPAAPDSPLHLSEAGRHVAIELFAAAKAAEAQAASALDFDEAKLLKELLKRVIGSNLDPADGR